VTLFEYLAIAFSLVFSFSAMRLVGGLPHALDPDRRYWLHVCWVFIQLVGTAGQFWIFWSYRDLEWSYPLFLLVLANPALLYFNACTLVPEAPASVESWRTYYYSVRKKFFLAVTLYSLIIAVDSSVLFQMPIDHPARATQALLFVAGVVGASSGSARVHAALGAFFVGFVFIALFILFAAPGSLGR
jgi:hypothetical protein